MAINMMRLGKLQKFSFILYDMGWRLALPLLRLNPRLKDGYAARILKVLPKGPIDIWIQAASAGEAYLAVSLIKALPTDRELDILVSTNTRQGMGILEKAGAELKAQGSRLNVGLSFFPFDKPSIMETAVRKIAPRVMVLLETELWPGLLFALHKYGCRILIINARMTTKSLKRYRMLPNLWKKLAPERVLAISRADADRFAELFGAKTVGIMPNIKFDRVSLDGSPDDKAGRLHGLLPEDCGFLVLGSIRQEEESDIIAMIEKIRSRFPDLIIGLFPRHMHRLTAWRQNLQKIQKNWTYRSALSTEPIKPGAIVLWDAFGELNAAYAIATAVFVGGSLAPLGGQNFLEPLIHGIIPVIGPSWENFAWVEEGLFSLGLVRKTKNWQTAAAELIDWIENPAPRDQIRDMAADYVKKRQGGTEQACRLLMQTLASQPSDKP
ncbi:MAG: 3-deoxy-D-manno-octulosonic acid transferase [Desulfobacterales bacterium]|nr:3-deoxy-D-manno-octulosonic acid transferase [Desulfobacterales bacterium]